MSHDINMDSSAAEDTGHGCNSSRPLIARSEDSHPDSEHGSPLLNPCDWLSDFGMVSFYDRDFNPDFSVSRNSIDAIKSRLYFPASAESQTWPFPAPRPRQAGYALSFDRGSTNKEAPEPVNNRPNHLPIVKPHDLLQFRRQTAVDKDDRTDKDAKRCSTRSGTPDEDSPATVWSDGGHKDDSPCDSIPTNATSVDCEDMTAGLLADAVSLSELSMTSEEAADALLESQIGDWCSSHAPNFVSAVRARIEGATCSVPCTLGKRMCGGFNVAVPVQFADGVKWLLKIPKEGQGNDRWTADSAAQFRQSALTQRLVRAKTTVPTPEIYHFDSSKDNELGYPYVLMEFAEGRPLYELLKTAQLAELNNHGLDCRPLVQALHDVARAMCQLDCLSFDKIGAPVIADDLSLTGETQPFWNLVDSLRAGPFDSLRDYVEWRLHAHFQNRENDRVFWARLFSMWICEAAEFDTFSLYHPDLNANNILVDGSGHLKAIIDWDFAQTYPSCMGKYSFPDFLVDDFQFNYGDERGTDECQNCTFQWRKGKPSDMLDGMTSEHEHSDYFRAIWRYCVGFYSDPGRGGGQTLTVNDLQRAVPTRYADGLTEASCVSIQGIMAGYGPNHHLIDHLLSRIWSWEILRPSLLGPEQWAHFPSVQQQGALPNDGKTSYEDDSAGAKLAHAPRLDDMMWVMETLRSTHGKMEHHYVELIKGWFHYALWFPRFPSPPRFPAPPRMTATPPAPRPHPDATDDCAEYGTATLFADDAPSAPVPCPGAGSVLDVRPAVAAFEAELASLDNPGLDARLALGVAGGEVAPSASAADGLIKLGRVWAFAGKAAWWMLG